MPNIQQTFTFAFVVRGLGAAARGLSALSKAAGGAGEAVLGSASRSGLAISALTKANIAHVKSLSTAAKLTGATAIAPMMQRGGKKFATATGAAVRRRLATPKVDVLGQYAAEALGLGATAPGASGRPLAGPTKKGAHMAALRENATREKREKKKWAALEFAAQKEDAIKYKKSLAAHDKKFRKDQAKEEAKGGPWRRFALEIKALDKEIKLLLFPFKFFGKLAALPFKMIYTTANMAGKTLNVFILRPLRAMLTISRVANKGFKLLGGAISTAFSVGLGPIGLLLKLFSPLLEMVAKFLEPAFEAFAAAIEVALGPLDFVIETLMQQLAPIIADTIKPFAGLLIAFLADTAPGFIKWFAEMAAQAAPLAAELAAKLVPAMKDMVGNIQKFFVLYGPDILEFGKKVWDFWSNASDYMKKFNILFIDPIVDGIKGIWKTVEPFVQPIFDAIAKIVNGLQVVKDAKAALGIGVKGAEVAHQAEYTDLGAVARRVAEIVKQNPGMSYPVAEAQAKTEFGVTGAKKMARGGVLIGEAGPEAVLPLRADAFAEVLGPVMDPGFNALLDELRNVRRILQGTITVQSKDGGDGSGKDRGGSGARAQEDSDLGLGVGMVPAW